jgi:predicted LPLAT superfamily acyltransferase
MEAWRHDDRLHEHWNSKAPPTEVGLSRGGRGRLAVAELSTPPPWTGRARGGYWGNWFFIHLVRWFGLRCAYAWLLGVAAYFTVANPRSFRCSLGYLERVLGPQPLWKQPWLVYRHYLAHGVTLLDRLAVIMGRGRVDCRFEGEGMLADCLARGQGILLLGAHLGNWEMGGHLLSRLGRKVNLVVLEREAEQIRALFDQALPNRTFHLLSTDAHPLRSIPILAALRRGEIVALHGDRTFGGADMAVPFLGAPARFPVGPYLLAAASGAPLFQVFSVRERLGQYRFFTHPPERVGREMLRAGAEALRPQVLAYVERLAAVARQYPFQWSNFYPFWEGPS